jgi:hypothetical protein
MGAARAGPVSPVLIGRDDLLALADRRLASAADGAGQLLFFAGEAGIGKSRLLLEVARRGREAGFAVVGAGASPGDAEVAAGLLLDLAAELRREPATAALGAGIVERLRVSGSERLGRSGSERQRRSGSERQRPSGSERLRPSGTIRTCPVGSGRLLRAVVMPNINAGS